MIAYDYRLQVWLKDGIVQMCGHAAWMRKNGKPCCGAFIHAGKTVQQARADEWILDLDGIEPPVLSWTQVIA